MKQVVIATKNKGKAKDFEALFGPFGYEVVTMFEVAPDVEIEETGTTFEENAILKAETLAKMLGQIVIADDSGLAIDTLNGEPGVYSARYAGDHDDEANMVKVLENMKDVPEDQRTARFCCALAIAGPNMETKTVFGTCEGMIAYEKKGTNGFGYDPIFYVPALEKHMAELSAEEKGAISHRGNAIRKLALQLAEFLK
ncbi:Non-canonical purine NTP pyrophosphatase [Solibacillus isronensis B3W22]|uniref:dITP/XTP pyrophosphatase n=1 Tax=Solibacillus isronensis B3W22 TaxID=1224748 RepID=K1KTA0_9BACL|nr:XTP/dITP diphosphatase [Solibacillus isronensis]AMO86279.1 non-canonical purine NTP pyrophosphatase [Solibacillus silvestris]EKB45721.1 Non-canonical purine NTP pyrophosphatase [Solibacillus isronensis B3W22]